MNASRRKVEKDCLVSQRSGSFLLIDQFLLQVTDLVEQFSCNSAMLIALHIYIYAFMLVVFEHDMCGEG